MRRLRLLAALFLLIFAQPGSAAWYAWINDWYSTTGLPTYLEPTDTLCIMVGNNKGFDVTLHNHGTVIWVADNIPCFNGHFHNYGLFDIRTDGWWQYGGLGPSSFTSDPGSIVRKSGGQSWTKFGYTYTSGNEFSFTCAGNLEVLTGIIIFECPILQFGGIMLSGGGTIFVNSGGAVFSESFTVVPPTSLEILGGSVFCGTGVAQNGTVVWKGGTITNAWNIPRGSLLRATSPTPKFFSGATVNVDGTLEIGTGGTIGLRNASVINNHGLIDFTDDWWIAYGGLGGNNQIVNAVDGVIRKSGGIGSAGFDYTGLSADELKFTNFGVLEAQSGTLVNELPNSWYYDGTVFRGGTHRLAMPGSPQFYGNITSMGSVVLAHGGALVGNSATLHGPFTWTHGNFGGTWTLASDGAIDVLAGGTKNISNCSFTNQGALNVGDTFGLGGSTLTNQALLWLQGTASIPGAGGSNPWLVNNGILRKTGEGTATIGSGLGYEFNFANGSGGMVDVQQGTLDIRSQSFAQNAGTIALAGSSSVILSRYGLTNLGTIRGSGTVQVSSLVNQGQVAPGTSVGTLTVNGSFTQQSAGVLTIELGGASAGEYDVLAVTGSASLAGTVSFHRVAPYAPQPGHTFVFLTHNGYSGAFGQTNYVGFDSGVQFSGVVYQPTNAYLTVLHPVPVSGTLSGGQLVLTWPSLGGASAYWVYGKQNHPWFTPGLTPPYTHRLAVVPAPTTTWSSPNGIGDPANNWTYLVIAVDASGQPLGGSNRTGEVDFDNNIP